MALLHARNLTKSYGEISVLRGVSLDLEPKCRAALVGDNGCGKSTLLRLLAGLESPDGGVLRRSASALLLDQRKELDGAALPEEGRQRKAEGLFSATELPREETASGGERMKLALSQALSGGAELLLLDEPTNDLDFDGTRQLLQLLRGYPGGVLAVSHDRYFLDQLAEVCFELEDGVLQRYQGGYSDYRRERERRRSAAQKRFEEERKEQERIRQAIRQSEAWAEKAHRQSTQADGSGLKKGKKEERRAKAKKLDRQAKAKTKRLERQLQQAAPAPPEERRVFLRLESGGQGGRRILQAQGLALGYAGKPLAAGADFFLLRGERMAVFGPNGCGKSTLLHTILGRTAPLAGELWLSPGLDVGVLEQGEEGLPEGMEALAFLREMLGPVDGRARSLLHQLGLDRRHLGQRIASLSLGERMKLKLSLLLLQGDELLLLDEPTTCLDASARDALENALLQYGGTLLLVSHDVYFLSRLCDRCLLFEEGTLRRDEHPFAQLLSGMEEELYHK